MRGKLGSWWDAVSDGPKGPLRRRAIIAAGFALVFALLIFLGPTEDGSDPGFGRSLFAVNTKLGRAVAFLLVCGALVALVQPQGRAEETDPNYYLFLPPPGPDTDGAGPLGGGSSGVLPALESEPDAPFKPAEPRSAPIAHPAPRAPGPPPDLDNADVRAARGRATAALLVLGTLLDDRIRSLSVTVAQLGAEGDPKTHFEEYLVAVATEHHNARWLDQMEWWRDIVTGGARLHYPELTAPELGIAHAIKRGCRKVKEARDHFYHLAAGARRAAPGAAPSAAHKEIFDLVAGLLRTAVESLSLARTRLRSIVPEYPVAYAPAAPEAPTSDHSPDGRPADRSAAPKEGPVRE
jgi:hypothetical protein